MKVRGMPRSFWSVSFVILLPLTVLVIFIKIVAKSFQLLVFFLLTWDELIMLRLKFFLSMQMRFIYCLFTLILQQRCLLSLFTILRCLLPIPIPRLLA